MRAKLSEFFGVDFLYIKRQTSATFCQRLPRFTHVGSHQRCKHGTCSDRSTNRKAITGSLMSPPRAPGRREAAEITLEPLNCPNVESGRN
jgi:hypothetical protein